MQQRHHGRVAEDGKSDGGDRAGVALGRGFTEHGMTASWAAALVVGGIEVDLWGVHETFILCLEGGVATDRKPEGTLFACARVVSWK